ncbi:DUF490 domain-containing protein [Lampropedia puyangensis]|uniref:DUF490 domain-containing protein n=1 Tax=Lampropedia puyangensis TaxID=1330072 RepID=A0A4S8FC94_9BURK|nr:translocation/assembly module TamB domain-containing protein [Lampropedia puyangensis]THU04997.1 DUF490 domain-containing protein [Lampropedia puyangensis]
MQGPKVLSLGGGAVEQLQWSMPGVAVEVEQFKLDWSLSQLFSRALDVRALQADRIHVRLTPTPQQPEPPQEPFVMPERITLPIHVSVPLQVGRLEVESVADDGSSQTQTIEHLAAQYRYDGQQHALQLNSLQYGDSRVQAQLNVGANDLSVHGVVGAWLHQLVPDVPLTMHALLTADGSLAGGDAALLRIQLDGQEQGQSLPVSEATDLLKPMRAAQSEAQTATPGAQIALHAEIAPWRKQPVQTALLQLQQLNAHAFHAAAPQTQLQGTVRIEPDASGTTAAADLASSMWKVVVQLDNATPGAWDQAQLPVRSIAAQLHYAPTQLTIEQARVDLQGEQAAGHVQLKGSATPQQWGDAQVILELDEVNLQPLMASLPQTAFTGQATIAPLAANGGGAATDITQAQWAIATDIRNTSAGLVDQQRVPLTRLVAQAQMTPQRWIVETAQAHVGDGQVQLSGFFDPASQQLDVRGQVQQLPLVQIHSELAAEQAPALNGQLSVVGALDSQVDFDVDIHNAQAAGTKARTSRWNVRALQAKGQWSPSLLTVERVHLDALAAKVDANAVRVALPQADQIEATIKAAAPGLSMDADTHMQLNTGSGKLALNVVSAQELVQWLTTLPVVGSQLPTMKASGQLRLDADWKGGWQQWLNEMQKPVAASQVQLQAKVQSQGLKLELASSAPTEQQDKGQSRAGGSSGAVAAKATQLDVRQLDLQLQGDPSSATLALTGDVLANGAQAQWETQAKLSQTTSAGTAAWTVLVDQLSAAATLPEQKQPWRLQLVDPLQVTAKPGSTLQVNTSAGQMRLTPPADVAKEGEQLSLQWQPVAFTQRANGAFTLQTQGQLQGLVLAWADGLVPQNPPLQGAGIHSSLVLSGGWNVRVADTLDIQAFLTRDRGDLWLGDPVVEEIKTTNEAQDKIVQTMQKPHNKGVAAGIKTLEVRVQSQGDAIATTLNWDTERAGVVQANAQTTLRKQAGAWTLANNAPLSGRVQASMQDLGVWAGLAPLGWRITGAFNADVNLAGTLNAPQLQGQIQADGLNLRSVLDGVDLHNGRLRAALAGDQLTINELVFQGGTGSHAYVRGMSGNRTQAPVERGQLTASGTIDWGQAATADNSGIAMDIKARLEAMQVLVRSDRQISLSGDLAAGLNNGQMRVRGDIKVDRASITLPSSGAPTLGSDVVVVRSSDVQDDAQMVSGQLQTAKPMDMEVKLDLGRDFALEGYGITTRLEGELAIRSTTRGNDPVAIVGEIRTDEGRYRAWGQALNVQTGVVMFNGPYANPSINMLAVRPNIDVTAGVRVTGTAQAPRVQLYSEPTLPDSETLSWVLLGRAPNAGSGDGNAMQQAALGLVANSVGSGLAQGLGFDTVGLSQNGVEIGKRLSDQLYVTYQAGLAGASSMFYVFYDITRRITLRGQTGEASAVDLIYTFSYD